MILEPRIKFCFIKKNGIKSKNYAFILCRLEEKIVIIKKTVSNVFISTEPKRSITVKIALN